MAGKHANRKEIKRLEILKSAAVAFRRRGYYGASIDDIASALQMTKPNLYYYFGSKEEILYHCHDYSLSLLLRLLKKVSACPSPEEQIRALILNFVLLIIDELHGTALTGDMSALAAPHRRMIIAKRDKFERGLRRIIARGMRQGAFRRGDPKLSAFAILGAVNWIPRWFDPGGPAEPEEIARAFAADLIDGLKTHKQ